MPAARAIIQRFLYGVFPCLLAVTVSGQPADDHLVMPGSVVQRPVINGPAIHGSVRHVNGEPAAGAVVRVRATEIATETGEDGSFILTGIEPSFRVRLTAWKNGHFVTGINVWPWSGPVEITLEPLPATDNEGYTWIAPAAASRTLINEWLTQVFLGLSARVLDQGRFVHLAGRLTLGCRDCHGPVLFEPWAASSHALGNRNPRFMSMYNGTSLDGRRSPPTRRGFSRAYGSFPLPPDPDRPYFGPGYKLDFPDASGNCATCHLPSAAMEKPYRTDPNKVSGVDAQGTHCDFCHKIATVTLSPATGRPFENRPGILSIGLMRPAPGSQVFFGPYDDVDAGSDTRLPLMQESEICAPCHDASFWGVPIYDSFPQWLASPYAAKGITCQSCHLKPDGMTANFAPQRGGLQRDPRTVATHHFPGARDEALLRDAVTVSSSVETVGKRLNVTVTLTNAGTGHHVPTGSPLRQMILLVRPTDPSGRPLPLVSGPVVPDWGGVGDPGDGDYAGLPGKGYAKILEELWTGTSPSGAYWNPTRIVEDSRLAALASDTTTYVFFAPQGRSITTDIRLIFRGAYKELMNQKGWDIPDIVMERQVLVTQGSSPTRRTAP